MNEKIRMYVNQLFKEAPNTKKIHDLKDEIISNANEKYNDLCAKGKTPEESYEKVISEIGDVNELIEEVQVANPMNKKENDKIRQKTAFIVSLCVGLYLLSLITVVVLDELGLPDFVTVSSFFSLAGISTCILIYHFMAKPKYIRSEDTMVEEFKEWKNQKDNEEEIQKTINSIINTLTVILYLWISFGFGIWYISWIIFLIAALVKRIVHLFFQLGGK